jgi:spore germination cell wall hydrolase CwlJ-like protein
MKISTLIGGILSSIAILAMVETYTTHTAAASVSTELQIDYTRAAPILPMSQLTLYDVITEADFECLSYNIYFESRSESALGQRAVAWVTLNRMFADQFPNTICEVVWQDRQFSWTHDGKSDTPQDQDALEKAELMAREVLQNYFDRPDPTEGSLYFHADFVSPRWRREFNRVVQIDTHIFYNLEQG